MGRFVIAVYRPRPGMEAQLLDVVARHMPVLRAEGLITDRPAHVMRAADGTVVEVFEWLSTAAIERAHSSPAVQALWAEFGAACDYVPIASLPEAQHIFAEFEALAPAPQGIRR
jgi:quinol monooxygenase YgiN